MPYTDNYTPVIEKVKLPSGTEYYIADREIRNKVQELSDTVAGGVQYVIAWDGSSVPNAQKIPKGVVCTYNGGSVTGSLEPTAASVLPGTFYLVKSSTLPNSQTLDIYDEYMVMKNDLNQKIWEKLGDTKMNLTDVVTGVTLTKVTDNVIGENATFKFTQPTITLATNSNSSTGAVQLVNGISSASAGTGDLVDAITGYSHTTSDTFLKTVSPTSKKLEQITITGVNGTTQASKAVAGTPHTTTDGTYSKITLDEDQPDSSINQHLLCDIEVSNGLLSFNAATLNTQQTSQYTFNNVTVPVADTSKTVATGGLVTNGSGGTVITAVASGTTAAALTALGNPDTDSVLGENTTITVNPSKTYVSGSASSGKVEWNNKDTRTVLSQNTTITVTKGT